MFFLGCDSKSHGTIDVFLVIFTMRGVDIQHMGSCFFLLFSMGTISMIGIPSQKHVFSISVSLVVVCFSSCCVRS